MPNYIKTRDYKMVILGYQNTAHDEKRSFSYTRIDVSIARILNYGAVQRRNVVGRSGTECTATDGVRHGLLECVQDCEYTNTEKRQHSTDVICYVINSAHIYAYIYIEQKMCIVQY